MAKVATTRSREKYSDIIKVQANYAINDLEGIETDEEQFEAAREAIIEELGAKEKLDELENLKAEIKSLQQKVRFIEFELNESVPNSVGFGHYVHTEAKNRIAKPDEVRAIIRKRDFIIKEIWAAQSLKEIVDIVQNVDFS